MDSLEDLRRSAEVSEAGDHPPRSRSKPWFVGADQRLMIGVISIVGILLLVRLATLAWVVEEAWAWASEQPALMAVGLPVTGRLPHGPIPVGLATWVTQADYPESQPGFRAEGTTVVALSVAPDGRIVDCWPARSSSSGILDDIACDAIGRRGRFRSARDERGQAVAATVRERVIWKAPPGPVIDLAPYDALRIFSVAGNGRVAHCRQFIDGVEAENPDCRNTLRVPQLRALVGMPARFAIAGRTAILSGDKPPTAWPAVTKSSVLAAQRRLRMTLQTDGRLTDCSDEVIGEDRDIRRSFRVATPCDLGQRGKPVLDAIGLPKVQHILLEDRISVRALKK